jgi:hypothetical protein
MSGRQAFPDDAGRQPFTRRDDHNFGTCGFEVTGMVVELP